jgi:uncharacterized membrane protein YwzB
MESTLRPMSTSQVLDRTFHLYRNHFWLFAGISALPPAVVLLGQTSVFLMAFIPVSQIEFFGSSALFAIGMIVMIVLYLLALALATGATVYAVSRVHLGHSVKIGESYRVIRPVTWRIARIVLSVFLRFAGAFLLTMLIIFLLPFLLKLADSASLPPPLSTIVAWGGGIVMVAAIIVGVIWSLRLYCSYQLAVPACVLENLRAVDCLKRSRFLSKGKGVQRILLVLFLSVVLTYALSLAFSLPLFILAALSVFEKTAALAVPMAIWQYVSGFIAGTLAAPIATIALALLYYDERVRKEAFDLQLMMEAMQQQPPPPPMAVAAPPTIG